GDDAVDHGAGEADVLADPLGQRTIVEPREADDGAFGNLAIVVEIVATEYGQASGPAASARGECRDDDARHAARGVTMSEVVDDVGMIGRKLARGGIVAISLFGHREREDADRGRRYGGDEGPRIA